ncbi:MAG: HAMP domain-containing sensor histidine kinase [Myxococcota bacterium]
MGVLEAIPTTVAVVGFLVVGVFSARRWRSSIVAGPLAALAALLATWSLARYVQALEGHRGGLGHLLDISTSPLAPAVTLIVVRRFIGLPVLFIRQSWLQRLEALFLAGAAGLSVFSAISRLHPALRSFERSSAWDLTYLVLANVLLGVALFRLSLYLRSVVGQAERARARLLAAALVLGWLFGLTEMVEDWLPWVPKLGPLGLAASSWVLAVAVLRHDLLDTSRLRRGLALPLLLALVPIAGALVPLAIASTAAGMSSSRLWQLILVPPLTVALAAGWPALQSWREERRRRRDFFVLGTMVNQLAHDMNTPVASIRGAAQFLLIELDEGRDLAPHRWFLEQIDANAQRIAEGMTTYRRLGRLEIEPQTLELEPVVRAAMGSAKLELSGPPLQACIDKDLVVTAVENVLTNAYQAAGPEGRVRAGWRRGDADEAVIWVEDSGPGIPLRNRAQVFEAFHTTKARGQGLGLPLVRRVMEAHGGYVRLEQGAGLPGLKVSLHFPGASTARQKS